MAKIVYADESYKSLDQLTSRVMVCYVEFDRGEDVDEALRVTESALLGDSIRFDIGKKKFHYSSFNPSQKTIACDAISKLNYRCKLFVHYHHAVNARGNESNHKQTLLEKSLKFMFDKQLKDGDKVFIEDAKGVYDKFRLPRGAELVDSGDNLLLIADIVLGVFSDYLDKNDRGNQAEVNYKLLKEKIRLQVIQAGSLSLPPLSKSMRL